MPFRGHLDAACRGCRHRRKRNGRFLLVKSTLPKACAKPAAGHWEPGETLPPMRWPPRSAGGKLRITSSAALLGCYSTYYRSRDITYLRFAYVCRAHRL